ncbi:hypothetical protein DFH11DRAFT_1605775 [Phellopilus nigrolimitatus]|nr:hypothetical protein DFH11DRAFT_1605775 [Phellopilus nigrolimitatus]
MSASTARSWALLVYAWERLRVSARYHLASFEGKLFAFLRISRCPSSRNQHRDPSGPIDLEDNCEYGWRGD